MASRRRTTSDDVDAQPEPINWRQSGAAVTLYDERNPDAWVRMEFQAGVPPEHRLFMICPDCGAVFAQRSTPGTGSACGDCGATFEHE
ncbi:hypothetical protein [Natrarchaeobaculum aegyptiacum]|uniref:Small CPxCG-related zinc finger protein n=1 Tax=Natrarchaeobaculum aegyptiacum TaxID=745377 RepID=A0A2Z2HSL0_9EURY|nr:hypothetical protein [Natrarchaeobaculum aegyptiacum]ARS89065.1 hypothetical protein B1756_04370 [Natrarchaeobaculum aegyptiacum]